MKLKVAAAVAAVRITTYLLRLAGRGGTSLPGKAALFLNREILSILSKDVNTVMITGTNGKTTTSRILTHILKSSGKSVFSNTSGANLISGITAAFAADSRLDGSPRHAYAVIECDEAAFRTVAGMIKPSIVVVTNLFRDQLDRYGEISHTLESLKEGIRNTPDSLLVINADDSLSFSIYGETGNDHVLFGINSPPHGDDADFVSDAPYCIRCKNKYSYSYRTFAHLGGFKCDNCGYGRMEPDVAADSIEMGPDGSRALFTFFGRSRSVEIALPGAYNVYNALAASAAALKTGVDESVVVGALSSFSSGFGRMERVEIEGVEMKIILVKNPAGLNQVVNHLHSGGIGGILVMILNDKHADGTDISWIWDANFEKVFDMAHLFKKIIFSGTRAKELMLRFKYASGGDAACNTMLVEDYASVIREVTSRNRENHPVYILPTYTAMFEFRKKLARRYKIRKFWE